MIVPTGPHEIVPSWLTEALHSSGPAGRASVTSLAVETIGEGKGFMSQIARLRLEYDNNPEDLPRTIIAKLPSRDPAVKAISDKLDDHQREIKFYEEVAPSISLQTPYRYYSAIDTESRHTVLLLEDLGEARQGDSVAGCSLDEAQLAIRLLAEFQAAWWESPHLGRLDWMPLKNADTSIYQEVYPSAWTIFVEKAGRGMPHALLQIGARLGQHIPSMKAQLADHPLTIVHGDYRLDNCFLGTPVDARSLVVFDWEFCARGRGTYDVATFICEAFPPQQRRREEMGLLRTYHSTLTRSGVQGYSFEQCVRDYRLSMLEVFVFWVVVGGYCDYEGERATAYLHNSLERFNAAIADLNSAELLSE